MGVKRPFDEEAIQELSFKHSKPLDDAYPQEALEKASSHGDAEGLVREPELSQVLEAEEADKELETSSTVSFVTSTSEEDAGNGGSYFLPLYPDFFEVNYTRRPPVQIEDAYTYLLNSSPRKEVPVGPDYQADVPEWDPNAFKESESARNENEQKLAGMLVIPMPNSIVSSDNDVEIGHGRMDCDCLDRGSLRCVQLHIRAARERLRESIGEEKFAGLGFLEMGEGVARRWTEEEECLFHEVVYSNPVSLGKNFWKHLSAVFPSRTKMELISYYFNVFILRRRAVQNRCDFLDIDSDDDEWQGDASDPVGEGEDDDSVMERFGHGNLHSSYKIYALGDKDDENDSFDADDGDADVGTIVQNAFGKDDYEEQQMPINQKEESNSGFDSSTSNKGKALSSDNKDDDARVGVYSDRHPFTAASIISIGEETVTQSNGHQSEHMRPSDVKSDRATEGLCSGFLLEACDGKAWDDTFPTNHLKGIDFLPTCNMIEEIFGPSNWKNN